EGGPRLQGGPELLAVPAHRRAMNGSEPEGRQPCGCLGGLDLARLIGSLELRQDAPPSPYFKPSRRIRLDETGMTENLTNKIVAWAAETGSYAAKLPSRDARETYLTERREELLAGAVAEGASEGDPEMLAESCVHP